MLGLASSVSIRSMFPPFSSSLQFMFLNLTPRILTTLPPCPLGLNAYENLCLGQHKSIALCFFLQSPLAFLSQILFFGFHPSTSTFPMVDLLLGFFRHWALLLLLFSLSHAMAAPKVPMTAKQIKASYPQWAIQSRLSRPFFAFISSYSSLATFCSSPVTILVMGFRPFSLAVDKHVALVLGGLNAARRDRQRHFPLEPKYVRSNAPRSAISNTLRQNPCCCHGNLPHVQAPLQQFPKFLSQLLCKT